MGKVQDEAPAKSAKATPKGSSARNAGNALGAYLGNLLRVAPFKPSQGKIARLWTGVGLGLLFGAGIYQYYEIYLKGQYGPIPQIAIPVALVMVFGWIIWRTIQFPPFADFLIATESEMNKVSWTSREDLRRATVVVLGTIFFLALYLFGVDRLWIAVLELIGVLKVGGESMGSQVG